MKCTIYINKELQRVDVASLNALENKNVITRFPSLSSRCTTVQVLKSPKTDSSIRTIFLPKTVAEMLVEFKAEQDMTKEALGTELKTFVHHTSYGCMVWFTNAIQANIRRETYTSQLMKGERCTIERPLFISSANFQLINICLHRIKKVRIHLHTLTSQQKIH